MVSRMNSVSIATKSESNSVFSAAFRSLVVSMRFGSESMMTSVVLSDSNSKVEQGWANGLFFAIW